MDQFYTMTPEEVLAKFVTSQTTISVTSDQICITETTPTDIPNRLVATFEVDDPNFDTPIKVNLDKRHFPPVLTQLKLVVSNETTLHQLLPDIFSRTGVLILEDDVVDTRIPSKDTDHMYIPFVASSKSKRFMGDINVSFTRSYHDKSNLLNGAVVNTNTVSEFTQIDHTPLYITNPTGVLSSLFPGDTVKGIAFDTKAENSLAGNGSHKWMESKLMKVPYNLYGATVIYHGDGNNIYTPERLRHHKVLILKLSEYCTRPHGKVLFYYN